MPAKGVMRPRPGNVRHRDPRVVEVDTLCACCFATMRVPVDHTTDVRDQIREESCLFCGRLGQLTIAVAPRAEASR